ncbi:MAG: hypothetical protein DRJ64_05340 [Thermoprotei archaeon]|nr:MAG: hypothetical protein DRJ64_05340 [Thermoprotei archaeon]
MIREFLLKSFPDIKFIGWDWIKDEKDVDNIMEKLGSENESVVVAFHLSSSCSIEKIMKNIPMSVISDPLLWGCAGMVGHAKDLRKEGARGFIVSSKDWNEIVKAFNVVKAYYILKNSTVLLVGCHLPEHILKRY